MMAVRCLRLLYAWRWQVKHCINRISRYYGTSAWITMVILVSCVVLLVAWQGVQREISHLNKELNTSYSLSQIQTRGTADSLQDRLHKFENTLLPYADAPGKIQELLSLAQEIGLTVTQGEYRQEPDLSGQFLRYRMVWPVKGDAQKIYRLINRALVQQQSLVLESIQFKRENGNSSVTEAKVQWALLTRLPTSAPINPSFSHGRDGL